MGQLKDRTTVYVINNNIDSALKQLKKKVKAAGIKGAFKEHKYYTKPSDAERRRRHNAIVRSQKAKTLDI